ncbi:MULTISPECIES: hypothetical protein [Caulobacter]|jgi:hypothetical protein|uniref:Uncharacterized protein n=1 Tax=Caulobacter vibrioides OR37 TaxID=1292034 RepID=R0E6C6_CAUVI|nr:MULTISPECIES: hypothetical protein [Caulobacter]ENZ81093.1 hypothetical protein OR37_02954 [Caulobacter vibrioides OR37]MBQ1560800.1 hypothetical protein [Caulobacter sp.]
MTKPRPPSPKPPEPPKPAKVTAEGVRRQRQHIKDLTGEDPLRGGVAD